MFYEDQVMTVTPGRKRISGGVKRKYRISSWHLSKVGQKDLKNFEKYVPTHTFHYCIKYKGYLIFFVLGGVKHSKTIGKSWMKFHFHGITLTNQLSNIGDACKTFHSIIGDKWKILYHFWILFSCYVLVVPLTWHLKTSRTPHPLDVHRKDSWTSFAVFQRLENCQLLLLHKPLKGRNVFWITPGPWSSSVLWHYRIGLQDCMTGPWSLYTCKYMQINSNKHFESLNGREFVIRICGLKQKNQAQPLMDYFTCQTCWRFRLWRPYNESLVLHDFSVSGFLCPWRSKNL